MSVTVFDTPQRALDIANDTAYGLDSGIWTRGLDTAYRFAKNVLVSYGTKALGFF